MPHPLDGVNAKIKRAITHVEQFSSDVCSFERYAYTVRLEPDINARVLNCFLVDMGLGEPPVDLGLLAGEVVYQLRSALDHIIYILAKQTGERDRQFPIFKKPQEYKACASSMIKGVSPRAEAIIEKAQPFQSSAPNERPLSMLNKLNNTDKHRVIPSCSICVGETRIDFLGGPIYFIHFGAGQRVPKDGTKFARVPLPKTFTPEMKMDSEALFTVAFTEVGFATLEPAIPLLYQLLSFVSSLVDDFRGEF